VYNLDWELTDPLFWSRNNQVWSIRMWY